MKTTAYASLHSLLLPALVLMAAPLQLQAQMQLSADTSEVDSTRMETAPSVKNRAPGNQFQRDSEGLPVYGSQLFQGDFGDLSFNGFNPNYQIGIGDKVQLKIWGAMDAEAELQVDAKGNVFVPQVGPVRVLGVRNEDLNTVIQKHIESVYSDNVESYAHLLSTQTARVFVSGFVLKPGLYEGFSSDSPLYFLDRAGGVDSQRGSYLGVKVLRHQEVLVSVNLYDFLSEGILPPTHFRDGDVILIGPQAQTVSITGKVLNPARFEFTGESIPLQKMLDMAVPAADTTTVSIRRKREGQSEAIVLPIEQAGTVTLQPGDEVYLGSRHLTRNVLVTYSGEHLGEERVVLPYGSTLAEAIEMIEPSMLSNLAAIQIYRESVAERQQELLNQSLDNLERSVLSATSASLEEARLRQVEAETILSFIERARDVQPRGQILLESLQDASRLHLEDGDIVHIPMKSQLVTVQGEVKYPNTQTHREDDRLDAYLARAGGFTEMANDEEFIIIRPNGLIETVSHRGRTEIGPGDEILVLPEPDEKRLLFAKEISTIIYQLALGARVVVGL